MAQHGHFYWNELNTRDTGRAKEFYGECIGWTFDETTMEDGGVYYVCKQGEQPVGGLFTMAGEQFEGVPEHWMSYIAVDDVDAAAKRAKESGGSIVREPFDVPGTGRIAIVQEPGGAVVGWMTPAENQ